MYALCMFQNSSYLVRNVRNAARLERDLPQDAEERVVAARRRRALDEMLKAILIKQKCHLILLIKR